MKKSLYALLLIKALVLLTQPRFANPGPRSVIRPGWNPTPYRRLKRLNKNRITLHSHDQRP